MQRRKHDVRKDGTTGACLAELEDALSYGKAPFKATFCENVDDKDTRMVSRRCRSIPSLA